MVDKRVIEAAISGCEQFVQFRRYIEPIRLESGAEAFYSVFSSLLEREGKKLEDRPAVYDVAQWLEGNRVVRSIRNGKEVREIVPLDRRRGLLLMGGTGTGKSYITNYVLPVIFRMYNPKKIYHATPMYRLADEFQNLMSKETIILDDVGTEHLKNDYGIKRDLFVEFVQEAYDKNKLLIITTNYDGKQILNEYGERTKSRLDEMILPIVATGNDFRTK